MPAKKPIKRTKRLTKAKRVEAIKPLLKLGGLDGESQRPSPVTRIP